MYTKKNVYETAIKLARIEEIFKGFTSVCNGWATLEKSKVIGKGKKIITVICDSGLKYLNEDLYQ